MTTFDRRKLFSLGLASAGASVAPAWLMRCFAPGSLPQGPASRAEQFQKAAAQARLHGKPVLVLIVPDDQNAAWLRGRWLGAFLNHANAVGTLELSLTVPACLKLSELKSLTGAKLSDHKPSGDPVMALLDVREGKGPGESPKCTPIAFELGPMGGKAVADESWQDRGKRQRKEIEARLGALTYELVKAMHVHGCNLATLAAGAERVMTEAQLSALREWFAGGKQPGHELIVRGAAMVRREAARQSGEQRKATLAALVAAYQAEVVKMPVAGARWMIPGGCGSKPERQTKAEKEHELMIGCGMAFTPPLCERFLSFYAAQ